MEDDIVSYDFDAPKFYDFQHPERSLALWNDSWFATHTPEILQTRTNRLRLRGRRPVLPPPFRPTPKKGTIPPLPTTVNKKAPTAVAAAVQRPNTTTAATTTVPSAATHTRRDIFSALVASSKTTAPSSKTAGRQQNEKQQRHHHVPAKTTKTSQSVTTTTGGGSGGGNTARFARPTAASISKSRIVSERRDVATELKRITERFIERKPSQSGPVVTPIDKQKEASMTSMSGGKDNNRDENNKENVPPHERSRLAVQHQQPAKQQQEEQGFEEQTREEQRPPHKAQQKRRRVIPTLPSERQYLAQQMPTERAPRDEEEQELLQKDVELAMRHEDPFDGLRDTNETTMSNAGNGRSLYDELAAGDNEQQQQHRSQDKYGDTSMSNIEEHEELDDMWLQEATQDSTMASWYRNKSLRQEGNDNVSATRMNEEDLPVPRKPMHNVTETSPVQHRGTYAAHEDNEERFYHQDNNNDDENRVRMDEDTTAGMDNVEQESHQGEIITTPNIHQNLARQRHDQPLPTTTNSHTRDDDQEEVEPTDDQQGEKRMQRWLDNLPPTRHSTTTNTLLKSNVPSTSRSSKIPTMETQPTSSSIYDTPEQFRYGTPHSPLRPSLSYLPSSPLPLYNDTSRLSTILATATADADRSSLSLTNTMPETITTTTPNITGSFDALFQRLATIRSSLLDVAQTSAIKPAESDLIRNMKRLEGLVGSSYDGTSNQQQPSPASSDVAIIEQRIARATHVIEQSKRDSQQWFVKDARKHTPPLLPRSSVTTTESNNKRKRKSLIHDQQEERPAKSYKTLSTNSSLMAHKTTTTRRDSMQHSVSVAERVERLKQSASRRASRASVIPYYLPIEPTRPKSPTFATDARSKSSSRSFHY
ncbi:hypothetical protein BDB00DRAFT_379840 [Zychaea mexicana]|uniref:uncharacterized protein n=1 Tax=Zychaea mexicana TaxID=64656 RepID=UPI0022FE710E|nr:uncharacterized protein BDB00DRAFT_379840 [Zychaea mexicana]KAI9493216.1 hypothetical protein BDB00DRAFT_379840 [Zychaea mexicana]